MKKNISSYNIKPESFKKILRWVKQKGTHECSPIMIPSLGGNRNAKPGRLWIFGNVILVAHNEDAKRPGYYVLTSEEWNKFVDFFKNTPVENRTGKYLGDHYKDWGCKNFTFWPAVLAISKVYQNDQNT